MIEPPNDEFAMVLASSVHDMKNSVGMLLNSLEQVVQETPPRDEAQAHQFATLQYEAARINTELVQLLGIYRMQQNRLPLQVDQHFVIDVLEDQLARNDMLCSSRKLALELDCDADLVWYFDAELIGGVINNVLVNSARYSREKIRIEAKIDAQQLLITVADDGAGYPLAMLESPQESVAQGLNFSAGNTHLGLYFARRVASMHRRQEKSGRIQLANGGPLGGSVFSLMLP